LIAKTRYDCLAKIMNSVDQPLRSLLRGGEEALQFCRSKDGDPELRQICWQQQLGSLMSALVSAGLWPFPSVDECFISVAAAVHDLQDIKVGRFRVPHTPPHLDRHMSCGIGHKEAIESAMKEDVPLTPWISHQLIARAHKSGAFNEEVFKEVKGLEEAIVMLDSILQGLGPEDRRYKRVMVVDDSMSDPNLGSPESELDN
jgi:hypothetical protein